MGFLDDLKKKRDSVLGSISRVSDRYNPLDSDFQRNTAPQVQQSVTNTIQRARPVFDAVKNEVPQLPRRMFDTTPVGKTINSINAAQQQMSQLRANSPVVDKVATFGENFTKGIKNTQPLNTRYTGTTTAETLGQLTNPLNIGRKLNTGTDVLVRGPVAGVSAVYNAATGGKTQRKMEEISGVKSDGSILSNEQLNAIEKKSPMDAKAMRFLTGRGTAGMFDSRDLGNIWGEHKNSYQQEITQLAELAGAKGDVAKGIGLVGAPLMAGLDAIPGVGNTAKKGFVKGIEALAKANTFDAVKKLIPNAPDNVVKAITKETDPKRIEGILMGNRANSAPTGKDLGDLLKGGAKAKPTPNTNEFTELVSQALRSGDTDAARALHVELSKDAILPSFNDIRRDISYESSSPHRSMSDFTTPNKRDMDSELGVKSVEDYIANSNDALQISRLTGITDEVTLNKLVQASDSNEVKQAFIDMRMAEARKGVIDKNISNTKIDFISKSKDSLRISKLTGITNQNTLNKLVDSSDPNEVEHIIRLSNERAKDVPVTVKPQTNASSAPAVSHNLDKFEKTTATRLEINRVKAKRKVDTVDNSASHAIGKDISSFVPAKSPRVIATEDLRVNKNKEGREIVGEVLGSSNGRLDVVVYKTNGSVPPGMQLYDGNGKAIPLPKTTAQTSIPAPKKPQVKTVKEQMDEHVEEISKLIRSGDMDGAIALHKEKGNHFVLPSISDIQREIFYKVNRAKNISETKPVSNKVDGNAPEIKEPIGDIPPSTNPFISKLNELKSKIKRKAADSNAFLEDTLTQYERRNKTKINPTEDIRYQIDRVLRSDTLASQFIKDKGLLKVITDVDNLDEFDQYLIAKHGFDVKKNGIETGRDLQKDAEFVKLNKDKYEPFAMQVKNYNDAMLDTFVESGMLSRNLALKLKIKYPNYVPLNRLFDEAEKKSMELAAKALLKQADEAGGLVGPVPAQGLVKRLEGSLRKIESPLESMVGKTSLMMQQAEKNKAAKMIVGYKDLPGNPFGLSRIPDGEKPKGPAITVFENGKKVYYNTTEDVERALKFLHPQEIDGILKVFAVATRIIRLGVTGLNLPFVAANIAKDQVSSVINANKGLRTSLANPTHFVKAFMNAIKHGDLHDDWVRNAGSFTTFDMTRNANKSTVSSIRAEKNVLTKTWHVVKSPAQLLRALENTVGRSEELTRMQSFSAAKTAALKAGKSEKEAGIIAGAASRHNTGNFARSGEWGKVLNVTLPYVNAGFQGARSLVKSLRNRPVQTSAKIAMLMSFPTAYATIWNTSDPDRKKIYDDIPDYEKENNIILIPPGSQTDEKGRYNVIKIPVTPGLTNLNSIVRRQLEDMQGYDSQSFAKVAKDLLATTTTMPISGRESANRFTPQALKVPVEIATNQKLFTGEELVPEYMRNLAPEDQVKRNTSGTARAVGGAFGVSPIFIEQGIKTSAGGVGEQLLNLSDKGLHAVGAIPEEQISGRGVKEQILSRFASVSGGKQLSELYDNKGKKDNLNKVVEGRDGKFYVKVGKGKNPESFDTEALAQIAIRKEEFRKTDKAILIEDDIVFRRAKDGDVFPTDRLEYDANLINARKEKAKTTDNLEEWAKQADELMANYQKQYQNPTLDEEEKLDLENKMDDLQIQAEKYASYGGFKKGKSGGSGGGKGKGLSLKAPDFSEMGTSARKLQSLLAGLDAPKISRKKIGRKVNLRKVKA